MAGVHKSRDCCEKNCDKGTKYDADELKQYMRKQKELRRLRAIQDFEDRAKVLECKKQRLRELDSKCKQIASTKKSSSPQAPAASVRQNARPSPPQGHHHCQSSLPHASKSLEKTSTSTQVTKSKAKRPKQPLQSDADSLRKTKSTNKLEKEAADFIFKEFEQIVRRECRSLLRQQGLVPASDSSISLTSDDREKVQKEKPLKQKSSGTKVDKNVGTSFSLYERPPIARVDDIPRESPSQISQFSANAKPVASSRGFHSLIDEYSNGDKRVKVQQRKPAPPPVPESVKNEAASKIQAAYKGYKIRSVLCEANLRGASANQVDSRPRMSPESQSSDSIIRSRKKMKFFKPQHQQQQQSSGLVNGITSVPSLQPEKPYDQRLHIIPMGTPLGTKSLPIKSNIDEIPGYIPPPPRASLTSNRAPDMSPRTVPLLRLKNPDEPFPRQALGKQGPSQPNLSSTSSPLKLISSISKFQLPYALQTPCSKDISSNLLRAAIKNSAEQLHRSPSQISAMTRVSRVDSKESQRPILRAKAVGTTTNLSNAFSSLPDPAFSTVLQEKIKMLNNQHRVVNGISPKKSKSPTKRSQMTAVSKATEQIKKKIVEAKQILEDYKLELLRTSPGSQVMSRRDDTYESDFDSESHPVSQRQTSLYGHDSEILSSLDGIGVELIPRPPTLGSAREPDESSKAESQQSSLRDLASFKSRPSGEDAFDLDEERSYSNAERIPVRDHSTRRTLFVDSDHSRRLSVAEAKPTEMKRISPRKEVPAVSQTKSASSDMKLPSTVTLRQRDSPRRSESQRRTELDENHEPSTPIRPPEIEQTKSSIMKSSAIQPKPIAHTGTSTDKSVERSDEEESEASKASENDTDYEDLAPSVSKASTNIPTEDIMYETDFETDLQSFTQSKPHHSLVTQKGGVRLEYEGNTQTSLSLSLTDPGSKSAAIQMDLPSEGSSKKVDQGVQIQPQSFDDIEDDAPSFSILSEKPTSFSIGVQKDSEHVGTNVSISVATNLVDEEYDTDFEIDVKSASVSASHKPDVMSSVALELASEAKDETIVEEYSAISAKFVSEAKDDTIVEEYSAVSAKEDTFISEEHTPAKEPEKIAGDILEEHVSVSESSNFIDELTKPTEEVTSAVTPSQPRDLVSQVSKNLDEDVLEDVAPSVSVTEDPAEDLVPSESQLEEPSKAPKPITAVHLVRKEPEQVPVTKRSEPVDYSIQTEDSSHISEALPEVSQSQEGSFLSETKSNSKKSVGTETPSYEEVSKPEQARSSVVLSVQSQTETFVKETENNNNKSIEGTPRGPNESQDIAIQAGILEQEPPTPLRNNNNKFMEDVSIQSEISENFPESDFEDEEDDGDEEEEKDMIELAKKVDMDIIEKIESLIASEISDQIDKENEEDSEGTTVMESRNSHASNFHAEDVVYASDFEADLQSEKSDRSGDGSSRRSLLESAVKQEVELLVQTVGTTKEEEGEEEKTGEGDVVVRPRSPITDPRLRKVLTDQKSLDVLIGRIVTRMFNEVTKARKEAFKEAKKPSARSAELLEDEEGSSFHGEVDGDAEWFEDDLISGGSPDDESLKREAAEIVAEQLRIENEIRALEALQAQVPATLMSLTDMPDKPPPPYSPPSSDSMSISLRSFTVQTTCQELEELIQNQVHAIWPAWKSTGKLAFEAVADNSFEGIIDSTISDRKESVSPSGVSKGAFTTLLKDLIQDLIKETLLIEEEEGPLARDYVDRIRPGSLALQAQRMRIPQSEEALANFVLFKVKNLIPYPILANDVPAPRKRLTKWTSRPRDLVDEVLAEELIDEDREWTESWPEEILVLDRWAEKFARRALHEVNMAFKTAFSV